MTEISIWSTTGQINLADKPPHKAKLHWCIDDLVSNCLARGVEKSLIKKDCSAYIRAGLLTENNSRIAFTPKGFLVSNTILADLICCPI